MGDTKVKDFEALKKAREKSKKWIMYFTLPQNGVSLAKR
jgi:hypothetical protein